MRRGRPLERGSRLERQAPLRARKPWRPRPRRNPEYERARELVFDADGRRCRHCGSGRITPQHVRKRSQGGGHEPSNLITLCGGRPGDCHDRADNVARGRGRLHVTALGAQVFRLFDERSGRAHVWARLLGRSTEAQPTDEEWGWAEVYRAWRDRKQHAGPGPVT